MSDPATDPVAHDAAANVEEHAILAAFQHLEAQGGAGERPAAVLPGESAGVDPAELRIACEVAALLPYALDPLQPPTAIRSHLLAEVRRRTAPHPAIPETAPAPEKAATAGRRTREFDELTWAGKARREGLELEAVDATLLRTAGMPAAASPRPPGEVASPDDTGAPTPALWGGRRSADEEDERTPSYGRALPLAMAAGLAFALLGLGYLSGVMRQQAARLGNLEEQLEVAVRETAVLRERNERLEAVRERFAMITTVAQRAYPLKAMPAADRRLAPLPGGEPTGIVYVCGNHQQWYLNLQGLPPAPAGRQYNLWFLTAEGAVGGGVLRAEADRAVEAEAPSMPPGTRGFAVTLESEGPHGEPEGPYVLLGDDAVSL